MNGQVKRFFCTTWILMGLCSLAQAELTVYESFNYNSLGDGTSATGAGLSGNWSVSGSPSVSSGLSYSGLSTSHDSLFHLGSAVGRICSTTLLRYKVDQFSL